MVERLIKWEKILYNIIGGRLFNEVQPTSFPFRKMEITDLANVKMAKLYRIKRGGTYLHVLLI